MEKIQERVLRCVYYIHTASYESLLNKARLPSVEVGKQMNIEIKIFKINNDLAPTYLLELIEKRRRTRNIRNSENILNIPLMLFGPQNLELFTRGIGKNQEREHF